jgi:hypothetical protein
VQSVKDRSIKLGLVDGLKLVMKIQITENHNILGDTTCHSHTM